MITWRRESWAMRVPFELGESLDNIEHDDKKPPTLPEAVKEANYLRGLFFEGGTTSRDMLESDDKAVQAEGRKTLQSLERFIKNHPPKEAK